MGTPLKILIADDEPDLLELLQLNLKVEGHDVQTACDGTQALEQALARRPDLVVLDVMMPGMDGLEVLRALRSEPGYANLPVVLLSARGSDPEIFEGWRSGANYYITKPFQIEELVEFVQTVEVQPRDEAEAQPGGNALQATADPAADADGARRQSSVDEQRGLEADLHGALTAGQFFLEYQPSFDLQNASITGVEALLRWRHPVLGTVQAADFIPTLERTGLIIDVGRWVLEETCRQAATWCQEGYELTVSVNVSAAQLDSDALVSHVEGALTGSRIDPAVLMIDVPEAALTRGGQSGRRLQALKSLGVRIAIDDFGGSQQPFTYLKDSAADTLKIDRTFISGIATSPERASLTHTLIQVAKTLGMAVLAKGIEHQDEFLHLQHEHCDSGQGFLFGRSLDAAGIGVLLTTWAPKAQVELGLLRPEGITILPSFG